MATVKSLLEDEREKIKKAGSVATYPIYQLLANTYALTYDFILEFDRRNIPRFLYSGHLLKLCAITESFHFHKRISTLRCFRKIV